MFFSARLLPLVTLVVSAVACVRHRELPASSCRGVCLREPPSVTSAVVVQTKNSRRAEPLEVIAVGNASLTLSFVQPYPRFNSTFEVLIFKLDQERANIAGKVPCMVSVSDILHRTKFSGNGLLESVTLAGLWLKKGVSLVGFYSAFAERNTVETILQL